MIGTPAPAAAWALYFDRGICEDQLGNWAAAEPDIKQALALSPDQPYVLNYLGYSWALHGEHLDQAQAMLQRAVSLDPNDGAVLDSLGFIDLRLQPHPARPSRAHQGGGTRSRRCRGERASGRCVLAGGPEAAGGLPMAARADPEARRKLQAEINAKLQKHFPAK